MSASSDIYSKGWYGRQLERLHREAPEDEKTTPEDALQHLPIEVLAQVLDATFKNYDTRASVFAERCLVEGELATYHAFMKAHLDIIERFEMASPNHYSNLASIIGHHFIRENEKRLGITRPTVALVYEPKMPDSPLSGTPTDCSVLSWIKKVEDNTSETAADFEQTPQKYITHTPEDSSPEAAVGLSRPEPVAATHTPEDSSAGTYTHTKPKSLVHNTNTFPPQRQRHPRKAKTESVTPSPSIQAPAAPTKNSGRGRKSANNGPTIRASTEMDTHKRLRGTKRSRTEEAVVSSEVAQSVQKRRKIAKPATKSKR